jgi:Homing endonuclease associated repeat
MKRQQAINVALTCVSDKKHIIDAIARMARKLGRAPSHSEFIARSGISAYFVLRCFERWNDAVRAAGLRPNTGNARMEDRALLEDWGRHVRRNRGIPTRHDYRRKGKYEPSTLERRFGPWSKVPRAFRKFAKGKRKWADVLALIPVRRRKRTCKMKLGCASVPNENRSLRLAMNPQGCRLPGRQAGLAQLLSRNKMQRTPLRDRPTCGNPIDFRGLRHEPVNEQGVVLLFGMLAKELGFLVEAVQTGFPDCEAKRQMGPERWQRVSIEFEFESKNFRSHRHPLHGCDVIVCWRHNWPDCPKHLEVVELSSVVKSLAQRPEVEVSESV